MEHLVIFTSSEIASLKFFPTLEVYLEYETRVLPAKYNANIDKFKEIYT